ncbi:MAG: hypothetical protein ACPF8Y_09240, partial [Flavobacteriales bacterium]
MNHFIPVPRHSRLQQDRFFSEFESSQAPSLEKFSARRALHMLTCLLIALPMSLWSQNDSSDGHEFIQERTLAPLAAGVPEEFTFDLSSVQFLDENPIHHI